ncbi:MAG: DUF4175 family protein [Pseudomonadota bacterium]
MATQTGLDRYYGRIERVLKGIALRLKLLIALEFLLRLVSVFLIILLGSLFLPQTEGSFPYLPFVYYLLALIFLVVFFSMGLWKSAARLSMQHIARGLEEKFPRLKDHVINAVLLFHQINKPSGHEGISKGLVFAHLRKTADEVSKIHPNQVVTFTRVLPHLRLLLPLFVAFTVLLALDAQFFNRSLANLFDPISTLPERETFIVLERPPRIVLRGKPVVIRATASGYLPGRLSLRLWPEKGEEILLDMSSEGNNRFIHRIPSARMSFQYQAFSGRSHSPVSDISVVDAPDIGKIRLTLTPPGYTQLPKQVKEDGHIEALKGTVVQLEAWATKAVKEGNLLLNQKERFPLSVQEDQLDGNLLVLSPATYSLFVRDELGFENTNPARYRIRLIPDKYPEGEIISPAEDLEVSGKEALPVTYSARDDFGVTSVRLIYQLRGTERIISLKHPEKVRSIGPEVFRWDLADLALVPTDRVVYRLAVWDNDSVSGPKAGYSKTRTLHIRDARERAARELARFQEIANALLDLLADQLEDIKNQKALSEDMEEILKKIVTLLEQMGTEKIERFNLESLNKNLITLNRRIAELPRETITQEMERLALLAEDLVKKTRMQEVEALAREIKNRQKQLIDALRDHKDPLTQEQIHALLKEIDKLKELISQVMAALSQMAAQLPDEFINNPDLRGLEFQDMFQDLDEIQKSLMAGDLAGALEAAQRLFQTLSEMMAAMENAGSRAGAGAMDRLQSEMSRKAGELEKILREQKEILAGTESAHREIKSEMEAETEKRFNEMMPRLEETMEMLRRLLPSEERDPVSEMERLLRERQINRLSQLSKSLAKEFSESPEVLKSLDDLMRRTKELAPDEREVMTAESRKKFPDLSSREKTLQERTRDLGKTLEMLSQLFPGMDTEIINDIKDAAGSMDNAAGKLKGEDAAGAIPPEQEAIRRLAQSQQAMRQMMARQTAQRMQANQWGYPWGYDPRGGWVYGPWGPLPTLPQPNVKRPQEPGYTGIDREEFDPPAKDAYKAPEILREKIVEALKEDIPSQYRQEVERYFRGLTQ